MKGFKLAVIDGAVKQKKQDFADYGRTVSSKQHAPVNWHAYAACTGGSVYKSINDLDYESFVLFSASRQFFHNDLKAFIQLSQSGVNCAFSIKGCGPLQFLPRLDSPSKMRRARGLMNEIPGCITPSKAILPVLRSMRDELPEEQTAFIPAPYPIEYSEWDFSKPLNERSDIYLATREFNHKNRYHLYALTVLKGIVRKLGCRVTVVNQDKGRGRSFYKAVGFRDDEINVLDSRRPYPQYLELLSSHKFVFQLDQSAVPGQVAGDAALCRMPCVGGNGTNEYILYRELNTLPSEFEAAVDLALRIYEDEDMQRQSIELAVKRAEEHMSFSKVRARLENFFSVLRK